MIISRICQENWQNNLTSLEIPRDLSKSNAPGFDFLDFLQLKGFAPGRKAMGKPKGNPRGMGIFMGK
jgi:hypothetical protein